MAGWRTATCGTRSLDEALAVCLPDVEILTAGGPGVPALAASYARSRGLPVTVTPADFTKHPRDAAEYQLAELLAPADAVVAVYGSVPVEDLLRRGAGGPGSGWR